MQLTKGANTVLPPTRGVSVECTWTPRPDLEADLSALLLSGGRVRGDDDFVFYNQPASADRRVFHAGKSAGATVTDRLVVDLVGFDDAVDTVAFAISLDAAPGRSLRDLGPVEATVSSGDGAPIASYRMDALDTETAAVALELYRRDAEWKVRAVGQGYRDGLAGLARDFGVDIADEPGPAPPSPGPPNPGPSNPGPPATDWRDPPVPAGYEL